MLPATGELAQPILWGFTMTRLLRARWRALLLASVALAVPARSFAQIDQQPAAGKEGDDIVVSGQRLASERAIQAKRSDDRIADSASADEIGSLPDFGFGEALQRIPGVALEMNNQRGEAQFATIRGLNSAYTLVTRDGVALPATEQSARNVSLDVLPSTIATRITAVKTLRPDMDGNAIGGQIDYRTPSAFDHPGSFGSLRGDLGRYHNQPRQHPHGPSGRADGLLSTQFGPDNQFGALVSASYCRRVSNALDGSVSNYGYYGADGRTVSASSPDVGAAIAAPLRRQWYNYDNVRERYGVFGKLEYQDGNWQAHLSSAYFRHRNNEYRTDNLLISSGTLKNVTTTGGSATSANAQVDYDNFDQKRSIAYVDGGAVYMPSHRDILSFNGNYAVGKFATGTVQNVYKTTSASSTLAYDYTFTPGDFPVFTPKNPSALYDPTRYVQSQYGNALGTNIEKVTTLSADYAHNLEPDATGLGFKAGAKARLLDRSYNYGETYYQPVSNAKAATLATALDPTTTFSPYNDPAARFLFIDPAAAKAWFEANPIAYQLQSNNFSQNTANDYTISEDILASYVMTAYRAESFNVVGGFRYEKTNLETASPTRSNRPGAPAFAWQSRHSSYGTFLPSLNASIDITPKLRLRGAVSRAIGRPDYSDLASPVVINQRGLLVSITRGNPDLKPRISRNIDVSLEWYADRETLLSVALFQKSVHNEIITTTSQHTEMVDGVDVDATVTQPANLDRSGVKGIELNFIKSHFGFLPGPLSGLGLSANLTIIDENATSIVMNNGVTRKLPGLVEAARKTANVALLYDIGRFKAQVAYNHTDPMLYTVATDAAVNDRFLGASNVIDLQASYRISRGLTVMGQVKNLTNNRPSRTQGPGQSLLKDQIDNGTAYFVGFSSRF